MKRRVVITGLGIVSPVGCDQGTFWRRLQEGVSVATTLDQLTCCPLFGHHAFQAQAVCEVRDFDPAVWSLSSEEQQLDRFVQFALAGAQQAYEDAHLAQVDASRVGVVLATAICGTQTLDKEFVKVTDRGSHPVRAEGVSPHLYTAAMGDSAALAIAARYGFQGECLTLSTGCIAGIDAIGYAYESIACEEQDVILAGGAEAPITPITIAAFDIINCLSRNCEEPTKASRPFCASRDGFVLSEGCGLVVLEELEHALRRNAPIYAEVSGWAVTEHASHMTDMSEEGIDLARAIADALERAEISAADVDFVNAHGTSTPQNDYCETQAIKLALGERAFAIPVNSTKSMLGHSLAAASAIEVVACALSLKEQKVHPTINHEDPDPACDLDYVPHEARAHTMETLISNASGFSGLHAALVMRQYAGRRDA
jgi:3-oxoacyl-(acyl-carrier-protein) synthase